MKVEQMRHLARRVISVEGTHGKCDVGTMRGAGDRLNQPREVGVESAIRADGSMSVVVRFAALYGVLTLGVGGLLASETLLVPAVLGVLAALHCGYLALWPGRTTYEFAGRTLVARRGTKVVREVELKDIVEVEFDRVLDWGEIFTSPPPISPPKLVVTIGSSADGRRKVRLPALLVWGSRIDAIEAKIQERISLDA